MVSSLDFIWNKLEDLVNDTASEKIYAYIQTTIESSNVDFLNDSLVSTEETPETGVYIATGNVLFMYRTYILYNHIIDS